MPPPRGPEPWKIRGIGEADEDAVATDLSLDGTAITRTAMPEAGEKKGGWGKGSRRKKQKPKAASSAPPPAEPLTVPPDTLGWSL